jgi:hypothetical protein
MASIKKAEAMAAGKGVSKATCRMLVDLAANGGKGVVPDGRTRAAMRRRGFLGREDKTGMVALSALGKKVAGYIAKGEL